MSVKVYGIKNCNTMKKTFDYLQEKGVSYEFYDYKKEKPTISLLEGFLEKTDIDSLINRKGMTFRKLDDETKEALNNQKQALEILTEKSSMIKRPVITYPDGSLTLGFVPELIDEHLA
ncbi:Spx/MgsR family RNA polymerase-binding regulatory protein [Algoriphagus machipongonensis]|uniref:Arsenate reductase n=1 Tax=Algoriphagus machipongonensis TaxID=388413 RepID=A3I122_9BACT|nr:Spx/MgsR family RNA polymerase-binding regulatory protein [Algoriphagus machipongonensis]EAZ80168.2 arsenate reductase [Algoriphagus machipongonensis]